MQGDAISGSEGSYVQGSKSITEHSVKLEIKRVLNFLKSFILRSLIISIPVASLILFVKVIYLAGILPTLIPPELIPSFRYVISSWLLDTIVRTSIQIPLIVILLELVVRIAPSVITDTWSQSKTRVIIQSIVFAWITVAFDSTSYYTNWISVMYFFIYIVIEVVVARADWLDDILLPISYPFARIEMNRLDHILLFVFTFLVTFLGVYAVETLVVPYINPYSWNTRRLFNDVTLYLLIGLLVAEVILTIASPFSKQQNALAAIVPAITIILFGLRWEYLIYPHDENGFWILMGVVASASFCISRPLAIMGISKLQKFTTPVVIEEEKILEPGQKFFENAIGVFLVSFATFVLFQLAGSPPLHIQLDYSLPVQIRLNYFDPCVMFQIGSKYQGFSMFGFILPFILVLYIIIRKRPQWKIELGKEYIVAILGTMLIAFFTWTVDSSGVHNTPLSNILLFLFSFYIGYKSDWESPESQVLVLFTAFWIGMIPADIVLGLSGISLPGIRYGCVGGGAWGLGDGLWLNSFFAMLFVVFGWSFSQEGSEDDE